MISVKNFTQEALDKEFYKMSHLKNESLNKPILLKKHKSNFYAIQPL